MEKEMVNISVILFGKENKDLEKQTVKDIEIISVDGEDIQSRNDAIKNAKGEYLVFVSAKDRLDENYLFYLLQGMTGAHLSTCGYDILDGGEVVYESPESTKRLMSGEEMQCRLYYQYHYQGYLQNKMFRTQILHSKKISFSEDLEENGDFVFLIQYLRYAKLVRMLPNIMYHFRPSISLKERKKSEALLRISETDGYLRCLKELPKHSDAMWLGEQTAAASALSAYEAMENEVIKKGDDSIFAQNPMKKMAKKCLKLDYEIEDEEEERLFLGLLAYAKTGKVQLVHEEEQ